MFNRNKHTFHILSTSPWPLIVSLGLLFLFISSFMTLLGCTISKRIFLTSSLVILLATIGWFKDIIDEGTHHGCHTNKVKSSLRLGMFFLIISEIMLFFSFFWAFFHYSIAPNIHVGCIYPPRGLDLADSAGLPLLNTLILVTSGFSITCAHTALIYSHFKRVLVAFIITINYAFFFLFLQATEYIELNFFINDGIYGCTFFLITGFHGLHVMIGTIFLFICKCRFFFYHFTPKNHVGFELAIWYWHFVDLVWLLLYLSIYVWGDFSSSIQ